MDPWKSLILNTVATPLTLGYRLTRPLTDLLGRAANLARTRSRSRGEVPASTQFDGPVTVEGTGRLRLGETCRLGRGVHLETCGEGGIEVGRNVRINDRSTLVSYSRIRIGDDTLIGELVSIRDVDHGIDPDRPIRLQPSPTRPIAIGRDVWIGRGAVILKGVTIGDGAVVGANAVVTRDVAPGEIVAGVPARRIKTRGQ